MEAFLKRNPSYYKDYYKKNLSKFHTRNKNRPSRRNYYHCIELGGIKYLFPTIKAMNIEKLNIKNIDMKQYKLVDSA